MPATLEQLIDQQITLGHKDPHEFPELLRRALGEEILELTAPYIDDFVSEMARHRLGAQRRASIAKITNKSLQSADVLIRSLWIPTRHGKLEYKAIGEMQADEFEARAAFMDSLVRGIKRHAQWCRDVAAQMRDEGVNTAKELSSLPPLSDEDE